MRIFVDIDGTLTDKQRAKSWFRHGLREDVIAKVKQHYDAGHEIILWTGNTKYARQVAEELKDRFGIEATAAIGKPEMIVDNQNRTWGRRLKNRTITPEAFLETSPED